MKIIELPFKNEQIFKFEDEYYKLFYAKNNKCINCDFEDCTDLQIRCNYNLKFKKIKNLNDQVYIETPFKNNQVFKYENNYYKMIKADTNTCYGCYFALSTDCIGNYVFCNRAYFKKVSYYEILFQKGDEGE